MATPSHPMDGVPADATPVDVLVSARGDLIALAYVLTGSQDEAQDIVHDVVLRLLDTDLATVKDIRAYARRAVTNEYVSRGRRIIRTRRLLNNALSRAW